MQNRTTSAAALGLGLALALAVAGPVQAHGKRHHNQHWHHAAYAAGARAVGPCDGFHRCRCGTTAARLHGLPYVWHGVNLKQAVGWLRAFGRANSLSPGNVVYQHGGGPTGHVSTIVRAVTRCRAIVHDDAGTYERDICRRGAVVLDVSARKRPQAHRVLVRR